jgi:hypothetical protein
MLLGILNIIGGDSYVYDSMYRHIYLFIYVYTYKYIYDFMILEILVYVDI